MMLISDNKSNYDHSIASIQQAYNELTSLLSNAVEPNGIHFSNGLEESTEASEDSRVRETKILNAKRIEEIHVLVEKQLENLKKYENARNDVIENNKNKNTIRGCCTPIRKKVCKLASLHTIVVAIRGIGFLVSGYGASQASSPLFFAGLGVYLTGEMADKCTGLYETHTELELDQAQFLLTVDNNLIRDYERLEVCLRELYEIKKYHELATVQLNQVPISINQIPVPLNPSEKPNQRNQTDDLSQDPTKAQPADTKNEPSLSSSLEAELIFETQTEHSQNLFGESSIIQGQEYLSEIECPTPRPLRRKAVTTFSNESQDAIPEIHNQVKTIDDNLKKCLKNYCKMRAETRRDENDENYSNLLTYIASILPADHPLKSSMDQLDPTIQLAESNQHIKLGESRRNIHKATPREDIGSESYIPQPKSQAGDFKVSQSAWVTGGEQAKLRSRPLDDDLLIVEQNRKMAQFKRAFTENYGVRPPKCVKLPSGWTIDSEGTTVKK